MNIAIASLIEVGASRRLDDATSASADEMETWELLFEGFLTDVSLRSGQFRFVVDSFPFLYRTLAQISRLKNADIITLDIGDGLEICGRRLNPESIFELKITNGGAVVHETAVTEAQLLLFLICLASDLAKSVALTGIDVFLCLKKFPEALTLLMGPDA